MQTHQPTISRPLPPARFDHLDAELADLHKASVAERLAYGRIEDPERDAFEVHLAPRPTTALIGRVLMAVIFLISGVAKLTDSSGTIAHMTAAGVPAPDVLVWVAGLAEVAGGLALIAGVLTRLAAIGLIVFLALATGFFHDFWNVAGPERLTQMVNFLKNVALAGGLALIIANGPGRYSIDRVLRRPIEA